MSLFDVNYDSLSYQLLPVRLRKMKNVAWLRCLIAPVKWLYYQFKVSRNSNLYNLAHNSQVVFLTAALNDLFDPVGRGIYIEDGSYEDPLFVYMPLEVRPLWLGLSTEISTPIYPIPQVLYTDAETTLLGNAFVVKVPVTLPFDMQRMKALINKYRLAGKNVYQILTY